jgi:hypothetical protein
MSILDRKPRARRDELIPCATNHVPCHMPTVAANAVVVATSHCSVSRLVHVHAVSYQHILYLDQPGPQAGSGYSAPSLRRRERPDVCKALSDSVNPSETCPFRPSFLWSVGSNLLLMSARTCVDLTRPDQTHHRGLRDPYSESSWNGDRGGKERRPQFAVCSV